MKTIYVLIFCSAFLMVGCSTGYKITDGKVTYKTWNEGSGTTIRELNADTTTFKVLTSNNKTWAKDAKSVFYAGYLVKGIDSVTFSVFNKYYGKDENNVVAGCTILRDADINSFIALDNQWDNYELPVYAKDINNAYRYLDYGCTKDAFSTYPFKHFDFQTFEALSYDYARDKMHVYSGTKILEKLNPSKLKIFHNDSFAIDGRYVYYGGQLLQGVDGASFKVTGYNSGRDKNHEYFSGMKKAEYCRQYPHLTNCKQ